jgi:GDPmannose 4,6-dehydratase
MWLMLQQDQPDDYVLATGQTTSVRTFVVKSFRRVGIELEWRGVGIDERGLDSRSGTTVVEVDPRYFRPTEVDLLLGDASKAEKRLGWRHETNIDELVAEMVDLDLKLMAPLVKEPISKKSLLHV